MKMHLKVGFRLYKCLFKCSIGFLYLINFPKRFILIFYTYICIMYMQTLTFYIYFNHFFITLSYAINSKI